MARLSQEEQVFFISSTYCPFCYDAIVRVLMLRLYGFFGIRLLLARAGRGLWQSERCKVRNFKEKLVVALSIATPERPLSYVILEGQATVTSDGLNDVVQKMCLLYDGPERGAAFAKELLGQERMIFLILP
ncbi:MAG: hypothetical protein Ct9H300mP11_08120 [Chloroflexota bacterium]|nr:MAG: hypothetical protein Ct9H300mP11_08120 [Chloroflexota bacterium]